MAAPDAPEALTTRLAGLSTRTDRRVAAIGGIGIGLQLVVALLAAPAVIAAESSSSSPAPVLEVVRELRLPPTLRWALDVRWAGDSSAFIAAGSAGVYELELGSDGLDPRKVTFPNLQDGRLWLSARLAASASHVAAAAPAHSLVWKRRDGTVSSPELPFAALVDMDLRKDRLLALGARRDDDGIWSPEGAIVWLGPLDEDLEQLEPVFFSSDGPGAHSFADCYMLEMGGIRFLDDGSYVVVPGVEDGVFLYSASGSLERTWQAEELGLDIGCEPDPEMGRRYARDGDYRQLEYLNKRRTLDEILPLAEGPALIVREVSQGVTRWRLEMLRRDGSVARAELPVSTRSGFSHVRGDVRGNEIVLLVLEYGALEAPPAEPPRLLLLRVSQ